MLAKEGYKSAIHGTAKAKTDVDADGNIITVAGTTPAGQKYISITKANADNNAAQNLSIISTLLGFTNATAQETTNTFQVKWEV